MSNAAINHLLYGFFNGGRGSDWVCGNLLMKIGVKEGRKEGSDLIDVDLNQLLRHVEYF